MAFVSLTRLRLRSLRYWPCFVWGAWASARQAERAPGFLDGRLANEGPRAFWTVTVWDDEAAMRRFRGSGAHQRVMPKLLDWCDEASVAHFEQESGEVPGADEALRRMVSDGRPSKVRRPSARHAAGEIAPDRREPRVGRRLRPLR